MPLFSFLSRHLNDVFITPITAYEKKLYLNILGDSFCISLFKENCQIPAEVLHSSGQNMCCTMFKVVLMYYVRSHWRSGSSPGPSSGCCCQTGWEFPIYSSYTEHGIEIVLFYFIFMSSWPCWPGNFCTDVQFMYRHEFMCTVGQNRVFPPVSPLPSLHCCFPPQLTMERAESWTTNDRVPFRFSPAEASTNEQVKWMACNYRAGSEGRTEGWR